MPRTARPTRTFPDHPDLDQLRRQAKDLLAAFQAGDPKAAAEIRAHYDDVAWATPEAAESLKERLALHDIQLVLARAYGFDSWPKLKAHVDGLSARRLIEAAVANDLDRVAAMLKARPDLIDMQWSYGDERRALHHAVVNRSAEMVRLLMQHGADARVGVHPHRDATAARTLAVERGFEDIVAIIDEEERRRIAPAAGIAEREGSEARTTAAKPVTDPAVRAAIVRGDVEWLRTRHARQPLVNIVDWRTGGLLTLAAESDQPAALTLLLDAGFDPDERVRWNEGPDAAYSQGYPLWHCAATGKAAMAEMLLHRGASPNVHVDSSGSPVYAAYSHRQRPMVDLLRRYGGVVTPDIIGLYRETDLARELLGGAGPTTMPEGTIPAGRTVEDYLLEFALSGGADEIVGMALERVTWPRDDPRWFRMLARGVDFWNHITWLPSANPRFDRGSYLGGFRRLVERCDVNVIGGFGRTALHEVAAAGAHITGAEAAALARMLLDAGARTDLRDDLLHSTPLGWAARWGRVETVAILLAHGADPTERDAEPWATPRAWAAKMGHDDVLAELRARGMP